MRLLLVVVFLIGLPVPGLAQNVAGGPPENVRMRIGPLYVNPTIGLSNAGVDTNVFNSATNPQSDYTVTISPTTALWLRFGPTWFQTKITEDIIWFNRFASERSANSSYELQWVVPLSRLTLTPTYSYVNTRQRPGFEIDTRAQRTEITYGGSVEMRFLSKSFIGVSGNRTTTNFDGSAEFLGVNLHDELNRTDSSETVSLRQQITPLTSISLNYSIEQDRFQLDPLRDSDSKSVAASIKFDPAALIKGAATFGYTNFKPASLDLPGFEGFTTSVDVSYVLLGVTQFGVQAGRNVSYSYDINQPYYVQTGASASVAQQVFGPFDVVVRGGLQRLEYRDRSGAVVAISNRLDHVQTYGGGIGYHIGQMRIGLNVDQSQRTSGVEVAQYNGLRYGFAVTYGSAVTYASK